MTDPAPSSPPPATVTFVMDGRPVEVPDDGSSLLVALRDHLGVRSAKDGCSPQGQCGCCTVLVDGAPRVSCVTPVRRVAGRSITTVDGLSPEDGDRWAEAFLATGASQCGFCTPGIICRLEGLRAKGATAGDRASVNRALAAHLCRCTGWQTIGEAWVLAVSGAAGTAAAVHRDRDAAAAARRATIEGGAAQRAGAEIALGQAGFADDTAPVDALVAVADGSGGWAVGETLTEARASAGKVQGRHGTVEPRPPLELPPGDWDLTLRTSWVEPGYLETDASWCSPGGNPTSPLANGGAFGAKESSGVVAAARELADRHGRAVRVLYSREDCVRLGAKRPPIAAGLRHDGTGVVRVVRTAGVGDAIRSMAPGLVVEERDVAGPPTSIAIRGAGWVEAAVLRAGLEVRTATGSSDEGADGSRFLRVASPTGAEAVAAVGLDGVVRVEVRCGSVLDAVVLRSYVIGAVHQALGWVTSEGVAVADDGTVGDLTIRSFGILSAAEMPMVEVTLHDDGGEPTNGSDAVFAAVAAAVWCAQGCPPEWPTGRPLDRIPAVPQ